MAQSYAAGVVSAAIPSATVAEAGACIASVFPACLRIAAAKALVSRD